MQRQSMQIMEMTLMCYSDRHIREFHLLSLQQSHTANSMEKKSVIVLTVKRQRITVQIGVDSLEDVTTSGKSMEETVPKVRGAANVEIVGLMVSLNRMEVGQGGKVSALDEIHEKYGFEGKAIVTMEEVVEHLYNRECQGRIVIDDTLKEAIDQYYKQYGCN